MASGHPGPAATPYVPDLDEVAAPLPASDEPAIGATLRDDWQRRLVRTLLAADLVCVVVAVGAGLLSVALRRTHPGVPVLDLSLAIALVPVWPFALASVGAYEMRFLGSGAEEFKRIGNATLGLTAFVGAGAFLANAPISRLFLGIAVPVAGALLLVERYVARVRLHSRRSRGHAQHRVVAVGTASEVEHLLGVADQETSSGWSIVGACIVGQSEDSGVPFLAGATSVEEVAEAARAVEADTIAVLHPNALGRDGVRRLAWRLEGTDTHLLLSPALTDVAGPRVTMRPLVGLPLLHLEQPAFSGFRLVVKRALDIVLGSALLLVALPILGAAALAIKIDSRGTVFYRQNRVGLGGDEFRCLKLRSMHRDADARLAELAEVNERREGLLFKVKNDPRITRVGRFIRRTSLDELPQLINVVRGDMSLVGPRPPLPSEVARYSGDVHRRLLVKPGMTGLWQVSGRSDLTWDESVRLDLYYVENWSPLLDLTILAKTVVAVVKGSGAY